MQAKIYRFNNILRTYKPFANDMTDDFETAVRLNLLVWLMPRTNWHVSTWPYEDAEEIEW